MVEGDGLENRRPERVRGFESYLLRLVSALTWVGWVDKERCLRGRKERFAKPSSGFPDRGFESLPLRVTLVSCGLMHDREVKNCTNAHIAQLVEHFHGKEKVTSSILVVG